MATAEHKCGCDETSSYQTKNQWCSVHLIIPMIGGYFLRQYDGIEESKCTCEQVEEWSTKGIKDQRSFWSVIVVEVDVEEVVEVPCDWKNWNYSQTGT